MLYLLVNYLFKDIVKFLLTLFLYLFIFTTVIILPAQLRSGNFNILNFLPLIYMTQYNDIKYIEISVRMLGIMILCVMEIGIRLVSLLTLSIIPTQCINTQYKDNQSTDTQHHIHLA